MSEAKLIPPPGSVIGFSWRGMPWLQGRVRKPATCWFTGQAILRGELAWRPMCHGKDRYRRVMIIPSDATNLLLSQNMDYPSKDSV